MEVVTMTATANRILRGFSMDFTMQIEHAMRADGVWFRRCQFRDARYGYKWSAWKPATAPTAFTSETGRTARLPKGMA
jgi:hypothetical protein